MMDFNCKKYRTVKFPFLCLLIIFILIFSPVIAAQKNPGQLPCVRIDVPNAWMRYESGPAEWYFHAYLPGGAGIWLMVLVYKSDISSPTKEAKQPPLTGSSPEGPDWLTGWIPVRTKSGEVWNCFAGNFPSGRDYISYNIHIQGSDGLGLAASAMILGAETFLKGKWTKQNIEFLRNILSSIRITQNLKKCRPGKTGHRIDLPASLLNLSRPGERGFIGAQLIDAPPVKHNRKIPTEQISKYLNSDNGALITEIVPGSPFIAAGIQKGDRIWKADSWMVKNSFNLRQVLFWKNKGELVKLHITRGGRNIEADVRLVGAKDLMQKIEPQADKTTENLDPLPEDIKTKTPAQPESDASQEISTMEIHGLKIEPSPVTGGEKFTFIVELTVNEADKSRSNLEVKMEHEILKDGKVLYTGQPENIQVPNGTSYRLKKSLNATRNSGLYEIRVNIIYGDLKKTISSSLEIK